MPIDTCIIFEMFQKQFSSVYVSKKLFGLHPDTFYYFAKRFSFQNSGLTLESHH